MYLFSILGVDSFQLYNRPWQCQVDKRFKTGIKINGGQEQN